MQFLGVDQDFADVSAQVVAQGAHDQARLLVDQERCRLGQRGLGNRLPDLQQVIQVPLQLFGVAADAGGADDDAHVVGDGQRVHGPLQLGTVIALDAARHAAGGGRVGHQHHVAAGQGDERGQGGALVAALILVHLDDDFLALAQQFAQAGLVVVDPGLEIVAGDFLQRQEAVPVCTVVDEGGFEGRFEPGDAALVDVGLLLFFRRLLDIDVVQRLAIHDRDAQFFSLRRIDQHAFHCLRSSRATTARNAMAFRLWNGAPPLAQAQRGGLGFQRYDTTAGRGSAFLMCVTGRRQLPNQWWRRAGHVQLRAPSRVRRYPGSPASR